MQSRINLIERVEQDGWQAMVQRLLNSFSDRLYIFFYKWIDAACRVQNSRHILSLREKEGQRHYLAFFFSGKWVG